MATSQAEFSARSLLFAHIFLSLFKHNFLAQLDNLGVYELIINMLVRKLWFLNLSFEKCHKYELEVAHNILCSNLPLADYNLHFKFNKQHSFAKPVLGQKYIACMVSLCGNGSDDVKKTSSFNSMMLNHKSELRENIWIFGLPASETNKCFSPILFRRKCIP